MKRYPALLLSLLLLMPFAHAEDDTDTMLKNTAIAGALLSWGAAALWGQDALPHALAPGHGQYLSLSAGRASQTYQLSLGYGRDFVRPLLHSPHWQLQGRWEAELSVWQADSTRRRNQDGWILGLTPVLRYQLHTAFRPFLEFGIGARYLSNIQLADQYKSTQFQFGDLVGAGVQYRRFQVGLRFLHISNAGIATPNPGTNYYTLKLDYRF